MVIPNIATWQAEKGNLTPLITINRLIPVPVHQFSLSLRANRLFVGMCIEIEIAGI